MLMKKNILLYMAAVAGLVLAGCAKSLEVPDAASDEICVEASIGALTKVAYDGDKSAFEAKDTISVYAWMGDATAVPDKKVVDGVVNTFDGQLWTPRVQMLWKTVVNPHYFLGIAPARNVKDFEADPYVQVPLDYAASDLLIATNVTGVKASDGKVNLAFDHAMAKLQVNLNFRSQWNDGYEPVPAQENVSVFVNAITEGTVNYLKKEITPASEVEMTALPLPALEAAPKGYTYSFSNLVVPQEGVKEIIVKIGDKIFLYTYADEKGLSLERGKVTTIGLKVGREQLDLEGISVGDWTESALPATDGEAMELLTLMIGGMYPIHYYEGDSWEDTFAIAENQALYQAVDARIDGGFIMVTVNSTDYYLYDGENPVSAATKVNPQGNYNLVEAQQ